MAEGCGCKGENTETVPGPPVDMTPFLRRLPASVTDMTPLLRKAPAGCVDMTVGMRKKRTSSRSAGARARHNTTGPSVYSGSSRPPPSVQLPNANGQTDGDALDYHDLCKKTTTNMAALMDCVFECEAEKLEPSDMGTKGEPCPGGAAYFQLPEFSTIAWETQLCFLTEHGDLAWPETSCCSPALNAVYVCEPPSASDCFNVILQMLVTEWKTDYSSAYDVEPAPFVAPADQQVLAAGMIILRDNIDIVKWAACLIQEWSPEVRGLNLSDCVRDLLTVDSNGKFPLTTTYVKTLIGDSRTIGAHMWAFTKINIANSPGLNGGKLGLVVPIGAGTRWEFWVDRWLSGGKAAFCAAVQVAGTILHEMIHICGDHYDLALPTKYERESGRLGYAEATNQPGTLHDNYCYYDQLTGRPIFCPDQYPNTCWDEARMVETIFFWAMAQRFTCLGDRRFGDPPNCCDNMGEPFYFAYSVATTDLIETPQC